VLHGCALEGPENDDLAILCFYHPPAIAEWLVDFPTSLPEAGQQFEFEGGPLDMLAADLDGDGLDDLALLPDPPSSSTPPEFYGIYVLINDGHGQLEQESFLPILTLSHIGRKLGSADIDRDGTVELLLLNAQHEAYEPTIPGTGRGSVVLFVRTDGAGFSYSGHVRTCESSFDFAVMDFNGDEYPDIVTLSDTSAWRTERIEVFVGGPGPSLTGPVAEVTIPDPSVNSLAVLPYEDGDVLVAGAPRLDASGHDQPSGLRFYVPSNGTLELVHTITYANGLRSPLVEDLDLDGSPEIICASWSGDTTELVIFSKTGGITDWMHGTVSLQDGPSAFTTGDFNSDGFPDILVSSAVVGGEGRFTLLTQVPGGTAVPLIATPLAVAILAALCLVVFYLVCTSVRRAPRAGF